ncbi:sensor histidine kinase [Deinococcus sp.]|uniref:sensor histidine kinase n=1 Tax=Deinococcus sp. TaxID=47478 RepID=UPI003C79C1B9
MSRQLASPERFAGAAFDALLANIAILDHEGTIIAVNRAWERFARVNRRHDDRGEVLRADAARQPVGGGRVMVTQASPVQAGQVPEEIASGLGVNYLAICDATEGEDRQYAMSIAGHIRAVLAGGIEGETEYPCELPDGLHYYLARVSGFLQDGGRFAVVAHEDITRRKLAELDVLRLNQTLEERIRERGRQLEDQNAELKRTQQALELNNAALTLSNLQLAQFAHVASHDLQEPLRIVGAYSDMLRHRYPDALDPRGQGYLNHITEQVTRARQMVRDVLAFSSVSGEPQVEPLDLEELWAEAVRFLPWPPDTRLHCASLPRVSANPAQIRQLLSNLLGNSLKFRSAEPLSVSLTSVRPTRTVPPGHTELVLRDNGIGVLQEHREQVFGMFQRLHSRSASGGNGIGLAVCKRIAEDHGGSIWICEPSDEHRSDEHRGRGTAVHFTLPLA